MCLKHVLLNRYQRSCYKARIRHKYISKTFLLKISSLKAHLIHFGYNTIAFCLLEIQAESRSDETVKKHQIDTRKKYITKKISTSKINKKNCSKL